MSGSPAKASPSDKLPCKMGMEISPSKRAGPPRKASRLHINTALVIEHSQNKFITFSGAFFTKEHSELTVGSILNKRSFNDKILFKILY